MKPNSLIELRSAIRFVVKIVIGQFEENRQNTVACADIRVFSVFQHELMRCEGRVKTGGLFDDAHDFFKVCMLESWFLCGDYVLSPLWEMSGLKNYRLQN